MVEPQGHLLVGYGRRAIWVLVGKVLDGVDAVVFDVHGFGKLLILMRACVIWIVLSRISPRVRHLIVLRSEPQHVQVGVAGLGCHLSRLVHNKAFT